MFEQCRCERPLIKCGGNGCVCTICGKPERADFSIVDWDKVGREVAATDVNAHQVGGDHYRCGYQHWDFIELNGIGYLEGCATKYVCRWRTKGGLHDLEKAVHYVEKLMALYKEGRRLPRGHASIKEVDHFCRENKLNNTERLVVVHLAQWCCIRELEWARDMIKYLMQNEAEEITTAVTNIATDHPDEEMTGASLEGAPKNDGQE